jgi:hypothetical protein
MTVHVTVLEVAHPVHDANVLLPEVEGAVRIMDAPEL